MNILLSGSRPSSPYAAPRVGLLLLLEGDVAKMQVMLVAKQSFAFPALKVTEASVIGKTDQKVSPASLAVEADKDQQTSAVEHHRVCSNSILLTR
jgi:hypothetical protein